MYVNIDEWEIEYTKSQLNELISLFRLLGAKLLNICINKKFGEDSGINYELDLNEIGINAGMGISMGKSNSITNSFEHNVHLEGITIEELKKTYESIDTFIALHKNLYYLYNNGEWKNHIEQRLLGGSNYECDAFGNLIRLLPTAEVWSKKISCSYNRKRILKTSKSFKLNMDKVGINVSSHDNNNIVESFSITAKFPEFT
jgi:hypothetical protein